MTFNLFQEEIFLVVVKLLPFDSFTGKKESKHKFSRAVSASWIHSAPYWWLLCNLHYFFMCCLPFHSWAPRWQSMDLPMVIPGLIFWRVIAIFETILILLSKVISLSSLLIVICHGLWRVPRAKKYYKANYHCKSNFLGKAMKPIDEWLEIHIYCIFLHWNCILDSLHS